MKIDGRMVAMRSYGNKVVRKALAAVMCCAMMPSGAALAQVVRGGENGFTFKVSSELVLVSVTVHDKHGALLRGLKQSDFTVLEDGKVQRLQSFDIEDVENYLQSAPQRSSAQAETAAAKTDLFTSRKAPSLEALRDRRLMVLFLDLSSLESDDSDRAVESAKNFVAKQMTPADLVSIVSFDTSLKVVQDFSSDKKLLLAALERIAGNEGVGQEAGTTGTSEGTPDDAGSFVADDTDYNIFNTGPALTGAGDASQKSGRHRSKEIDFVLQQWHDQDGRGEPGAVACRGERRGAFECVDLRGGLARPAGVAAGRDCKLGKSARSFLL